MKLSTLLSLSALYVLSYAPVVKCLGNSARVTTDPGDGSIGLDFAPWDSNQLPVYKPVDWMIDHTVFREPLLRWAELWGLHDAFSVASSLRKAGV